MKKLIIIPLSTLLLTACETMESQKAYEDMENREIMDTQAITDKERHRMAMEEDEALGYPLEK